MQKEINETLAEGLEVWQGILCRGARAVSLTDLLGEGLGEQKLRRILRTLEAAGMLDRQGGQWVLGLAFKLLYADYLKDQIAREKEAEELRRINERERAALSENTRRAAFVEGRP